VPIRRRYNLRLNRRRHRASSASQQTRFFPLDRGDINDIRPAVLSDLAQIAARLRAGPFGHVEVRGYTDRLGSDSYNWSSQDVGRKR
jgi:outer membrane protein OmpA-like peptidoglycan-associated protein